MTVELPSKRPRAVKPSAQLCRRAIAFFSLLTSLIAFNSPLGAQQRARNAGPQWADSTGESDVYPVGDAVGVYRAVLDLLYVDGHDRPPYILLWDTATRQAIGPCTWNPCTDKWPHKSEIDSATILAYARSSIKRPRIVDFGYKIRIRRVNTSEFERLQQDGYGALANVPPEKVGPQEAFWAGFRKKHPNAWGYAMLSKVGFNAEHTQALIGVMQNCGEGCRSTEEMFLKRIGNEWKVIERVPEDVETYRTSGNQRYRGPAGTQPSQSQLVVTDSSASAPRSESDDATGVYRAVLDRLYNFYGESPRALVITEMRAQGWTVVPATRSKIDSSTLVSFGAYARVRDAMYPRFKYRIPITWISDTALKQLERSGTALAQAAVERLDQEQSPLWLAFHARYPDAWGYAGLGRVGFNPEHTQALVYTNHHCGSECDNADIWFLERKNDQWYIVERIPAGGEFNDWGPQLFRYLGADVDSTRYRPTRIRGVVTQLETGAVLPELQLEIVHRKQSTFFQTDKDGRYTLENLPPEGYAIRVKCPPKSPVDWVVVEPLVIKPGMDATVNLAVSFAECSQQ